MATTSKYNIDWLCRTCMQELDEVTTSDAAANIELQQQQQWRSIIDTIEECDALQIAELISNTLKQIEVQLSDELPKKICRECLESLIRAYRFQQTCLKTEQNLHTLLAKRNYELLKATTLSTADEEQRVVNEFVKQEPLAEGINQGIECEYVNAIEAQAGAQTNNESIEDYISPLDDLQEFLKIEPCDDTDTNNKQCDDYTVDDKINSDDTENGTETEESNVKLRSSPAECNICHKTIQHKGNLARHYRWHQKIRSLEHRPKPKTVHKLSCGICQKTVSSTYSLKRHIKEQHSKEKVVKKASQPTVFVCDFCKKIFNARSTLAYHLKFTHTTERPYQCPKCEKAFKRKMTLKHHIERHSNDRPHECPHCPLRFRCVADLSKHRRTHSEFKSNVCDTCGKGFITPTQLKMHKMTHGGEKPFKCDFCEKRFYRNYDRVVHMRTHTGEKPYKCKYCERAYAYAGDCNKHLRTHVGDNVYRCKFCPLTFRLESEMRLHFTTHKNEDPDTRERNFQALKEEEAKLELKLAGKGI